MMVIRRKLGETIVIDKHIRLVVLEIQNGQAIRFGIEAPEDVAVHRLEVYEQIQEENKSAAGNTLAWLKQEKSS